MRLSVGVRSRPPIVITAVVHKNLASAEGYFSEHLSRNDYYTAGEVQPGRWIGLGSARLKLSDAVTQEAFVALCENRDPASHSRLTQRSQAEGDRRVFYDFTCSAPKSVSVMAVTFNDPRLVAAHEEAARVAFAELEAFAATRVRRSLKSSDRTSGNLVAAEFLHTSSRALDPQLHTHFTVFNATWDAVEHRWKALQAGAMYAAVRYATQVYRNELAWQIQRIGYQTVTVGNGFEIAGVHESVLKKFSKRSAERDRVVSEMESKLGRTLSKDEVAFAVHRSRPRKITGISTEDLRTRQLQELDPIDRQTLHQLRDSAREGTGHHQAEESSALNFAVAHVFERRSVVPAQDVLEAAITRRHGTVNLSRLKAMMASHPDLLSTDQGLSTRANLEQELDLILEVRRGKGSSAPIRPDFVPHSTLAFDQVSALRRLLQGVDRIQGLRGLAGSGKTTVLRELARAGGEAGIPLRFCAPTAAAAEVLRSEGLDAATVARVNQLPPDPKAITVVDEAGALGLSDLHCLLQKSGRVILCGDTGQHASVARGDALRILEEHSPLTVVELTRIRRQRRPEYRAAVEKAAQRDSRGAFDLLERMGAISSMPTDQVHQEAARLYTDNRIQDRSALLIAPTWSEIDALTRHVRDSLKERGLLEREERAIPVMRSLSWTLAQTADVASYRPGLWLRFHHARGSFAKNETAEVIAVGATLRVRCSDGAERDLDIRRYAGGVEVGERHDLAVSVGERLLLRSNSPGIINGELVEVRGFEGTNIRLKDGRTLGPGYRTFTHGYALTSHAAQGKTVDEVILVATARSLPAVHREQFYVSISRGRDQCRILTDDLALLRGHVGRSSRRIAAIETKPQKNRHRRLLERGLAWLRELRRRLRIGKRAGQRRAPTSPHVSV